MDTNHTFPEAHPLHRLFRGLTESTFMDELGIGDPKLVGYVSNLLAEFVRTWPVHDAPDRDGQHLSWILTRVAQAEAATAPELRMECHRQVGDFALFWTGVFPEILSKIQGRRSLEPLINYQKQGKRSYFLASTLTEASSQGAVLRRLSEQFEVCAFGLSRVRREWEKLEAEGTSARGSIRPIW